jgi:transcriptional regulator with XRE-family HTH domain
MKKASEKTILATRLCEVMEDANVTHEDLGKAIGISRQAVTQYCDGSAKPSLDKLCKISDFFNVSSDYLLGLIDNKSKNISDKAIHNALGISDKAIAALRLSRLVYPTKTQKAEEIEAKLIKEAEELEVGQEYHTLKDLMKGLKAPQKIAMYKAASNTIPCLEVLLKQRATLEEPRVLDLLLDYFNFEEQDFVAQAQTLPNYFGGTKEGVGMITGKRMAAIMLDDIKDALKELKKELKSGKANERCYLCAV